MVIPRGYQSSATLPNGDVFTVGGSWSFGRGGKFGEIYSATDRTWSGRPNVEAEPMSTDDRQGIFAGDNHMWMFAAPNGLLFNAGPSNEMHWIDPAISGGIIPAGQRGTVDLMNGKAVMYDVGKILSVGGAVDYSGGVQGYASSWVIDVNGGVGNVETRQVADMAYARVYSNAVVLPSGEVVVIGGTAAAEAFGDAGSVFATEIWNPTTEQFTTHAVHQRPRNYHSSAVLLKDGRVRTEGGLNEHSERH